MFYSPARGFAEVRERATLAQASLVALLVHGAYALYTQWPNASGALAPLDALVGSAGVLVLLGLFFVPVCVLLANLFDRRASFGLILRQEYGTTAATVFYALAAASLAALPLAVAARLTGFEAETRAAANTIMELLRNLPPEGPGEADRQLMSAALPKMFLLLLLHPLFLFAPWAVVAVREVFRLSWLRSLLVVFIALGVMFFASPLFVLLFGALLSLPFLLLLFLFFILRGYIGEAAKGQRARAAFRQNLEAATLNPADASAHYNLGLIHLQRKELDEARKRFERAVEIDPDEIDAHFQLGRIARTENRLPDAVGHFEQVVARDSAHAQHEIWREIGATYLAASQFADAHDALERFLDQRRLDPEGLYLMGRALAGMGRQREAAQSMRACIEAVQTSPAYKYRAEKHWLNEAQQFLRSQA